MDDSNHIERRNLRFFLQSPYCATNCLQQVIRVQSCANHVQHWALIMCNMWYAMWYEGIAQLFILTELKLHLFLLYFIGWNH